MQEESKEKKKKKGSTRMIIVAIKQSDQVTQGLTVPYKTRDGCDAMRCAVRGPASAHVMFIQCSQRTLCYILGFGLLAQATRSAHPYTLAA